MAEDQEEIDNTLKSVRNLINSSRKSTQSDNEILELTEDDLFDERDEDAQDIDQYKKNEVRTKQINQLLTPVANNKNNVLEKAIAESIKPYLKEWIEEIVIDSIKKELKKY